MLRDLADGTLTDGKQFLNALQAEATPRFCCE
jgi:hypothetical protein